MGKPKQNQQYLPTINPQKKNSKIPQISPYGTWQLVRSVPRGVVLVEDERCCRPVCHAVHLQHIGHRHNEVEGGRASEVRRHAVVHRGGWVDGPQVQMELVAAGPLFKPPPPAK